MPAEHRHEDHGVRVIGYSQLFLYIGAHFLDDVLAAGGVVGGWMESILLTATMSWFMPCMQTNSAWSGVYRLWKMPTSNSPMPSYYHARTMG
jgi:hypothetical protein